jgi:replicative DNA helicase
VLVATVSANRKTQVSSLRETLAQLEGELQSGPAADAVTQETGFSVLDELLGGGMRAGELVLVGGPPGVGKTVAALQWARHAAMQGHRAIFVCYEHEPVTLLIRLLAMELGEAGTDRASGRALAATLGRRTAELPSLQDILADLPGGEDAMRRISSYADDLVLVRGSGAHTTLTELETVLEERTEAARPGLLFVDYLQKIPIHPEPDVEAEKVTRTVEGLKDLALEHRVPIVLLSAVDGDGMRSSRLRLHHLRGSSAIAFEADVVLMMNEKLKAVSKVHLAYDEVRAKTFRDWVVLSVEKNRGGPNLVDLEFRKDFAHFRFEPAGGLVAEKLVTERLDEANM